MNRNRIIIKNLFLCFMFFVFFINDNSKVDAYEPEVPSFSDGRWLGAFFASGSEVENGLEYEGKLSGDFFFQSREGLLDGIWDADGFISNKGVGVEVFADYLADGLIVGDNENPVMQLNEMVINFEGNVNEIPINTSMTIGADSSNLLEIKLTSATCNIVVGDFVASLGNHFSEAGSNNLYSNGKFSAIRVGDLSSEELANYNQEIGELILRAQEFKDNVEKEDFFNWNEFNKITQRAEQLMSSLSRGADCEVSNTNSYQSIISDVISDIYSFAINNNDSFTTDSLSRLTYLGVRMGVTGSGAPYQDQANFFEMKMAEILEKRLDDAILTNNYQEITNVFVAAGPLGNEVLNTKAYEAFNSIP